LYTVTPLLAQYEAALRGVEPVAHRARTVESRARNITARSRINPSPSRITVTIAAHHAAARGRKCACHLRSATLNNHTMRKVKHK